MFCIVLYILTWKYAPRHNGVHFFDSPTSKSSPHVTRFEFVQSQMCLLRATTTFNFSSLIWPDGSAPAASYFSTLPSHKSLEKQSVSRLSYPFAHLDVLLTLLLFAGLLSSNLSLLSASALLCFSCVHIVGSLTSKLPSIIL